MERIKMLKSTIQLFVKALIIGALVNSALQSAADTPSYANQSALPHYDTSLLEQTHAQPAP